MIKNYLDDFKKILITGGAGFIGKNLIIKLLKNYSSEIFCLDKLSYASDLSGIKLSTKENQLDLFNFYNIDLNDALLTKDIIKSIKPDLIFHLAAESHVDNSITSPEDFVNSNIVGTYNLLNSINFYWNDLPLKKKNSFRLISISTDEVFGSLSDKGFFNEQSRYNPMSPYSASKASADHLVRAWSNTYGIPSIITYCSNNFGPWQYPEKIIPVTIINALSGKKIPLYGDGENIRDWLYVEDHVEALIKVACNGVLGESYCIGGENLKTNKELMTKICFYLDDLKPSSISYKELITFVEDRPGHDFRYAINPSKIKNTIGWESRFDFEEKLQETIKWYVDNINWSKRMQIK